ncbi:MAG: flavodoxin [Acidimicrobiia bacterium]|nr:flavodoxin [Acidimicrobiia bacterium]
MNVVVLYESMTGNTRKAAELIGGAVKSVGADVSVRSVRNIDYHELAVADLVFVGTWVDGLILFGHRPGGGGALKNIPVLDHKQVAVYMTYAIHAGGALNKFAKLMRDGKGADIVAAKLFKRGSLEAGMGEFVADALSAVPA